MQYLLSVLIPCYNCSDNIKSLLKSIDLQTKSDLNVEVIICNDGSRDDSLEILHNIPSDLSNITVSILTQENKGVSTTRNNLLKSASGQYIWFIDSDDKISKDALSTILSTLDQYPMIDLINFSYLQQLKDGKAINYKVKYYDDVITGQEFLKNNDGRLYLWDKIYRYDIIETNKLRFDEELNILEDSLFNIKYLLNCKMAITVDEPLYTYTYQNDSISKNHNLNNLMKLAESSIKFHKKLKNLIDNKLNSEEDKIIIKSKLNLSILGFFYSLLREKYPLDYTKTIFDIYKNYGLYPIPKGLNLNIKAKAFRILVNSRQIFLLLSKINLMRK